MDLVENYSLRTKKCHKKRDDRKVFPLISFVTDIKG
jgi:hypothetical protein